MRKAKCSNTVIVIVIIFDPSATLPGVGTRDIIYPASNRLYIGRYVPCRGDFYIPWDIHYILSAMTQSSLIFVLSHTEEAKHAESTLRAVNLIEMCASLVLVDVSQSYLLRVSTGDLQCGTDGEHDKRVT